MLLLRGGDAFAGRAHVEKALAIFEQSGVETNKAQFMLSMAEIALAKRDTGATREWAEQSLALAERLGETATESDAHYWLAQAAQAEGDDQAVDAEFAAALSGPEERERRGRMASYRVAYAEILEGRGDILAANRQLKLALAALGHRVVAAEGARSATA